MALDVKKISEKDGVAKFLVKGTNSIFLNSVRRTIMNDIPVLAVEDVSVYENQGTMFDEFLAHRLGLLPIKTDLKTYKKKDKVKMVLEKEGPCTVYSKDIKCTDPKIEISGKKIPITKLQKGQKLKVEMAAVMGTGKEHAKWQPAIVSYNEIPSITNKKAADVATLRKCVESCPTNVLEVRAKKVVLKDPYNCTLCKECMEKCPEAGLEIEYSRDTFVLTIEPVGQLTMKEIFMEAANSLKEKSKEFKKELSKL